MASYPTKLAEGFAAQALKRYYGRSVTEMITNQDYEGEVKEKGSIVNILTFDAITSQNYSGSNLTADDLGESNAQLTTDQAKAFYFKVKSYDTFRSYIKNPEGTILDQVANELKKVIDQYVLGFYGDVAAGNRIGTDYTTGTVEVTATTGAVAGSGTTFTAAMVGRGFKADGHSVWYRVKTYTNGTTIVIEDDLDDTTSAYTGGAISAGASYTIEAATAVQVTAANIYGKINDMRAKLTNQEIPDENRWLVIPAEVASLVRQSTQFVGVGSERGHDKVENGLIGRIAGFDVYEVSDTRLGGDSTGWHVIGGHKSAITFAMGLTENGMEDLIGNFGKAYKSLYVYGAKVADERRKGLVELFCKL